MNKERIEASYPLSQMQQGMLLPGIHDRESGAYLQQMVCVLRENVDAARLADAWQFVMQRHEVLRTSFRWDGQSGSGHGPMQEVHSNPELSLVSDDWTGLTAEHQQHKLDQFFAVDRQHGFELALAPLMRVALFKLGAVDYRMVWTFHHALLDGRSHLFVLQELFAFYEASEAGEPLDLDQPRPYREYIEWLGQQDLAKAELFWREALAGFTAPTSLRVGQVHTPDHQGQPHNLVQVELSEELTAALRLRAKENEVTLNNLVQASWALLLSWCSAEGDVLFGTTRACRHWTAEDAGSMIGLFINTLPFRVQVRPEQPLDDWLKELRAQHLGLRDYEHTPLLKIKEWSAVPRGTSLFDSVLVFEDYQFSNRLRSRGGNWTRRDFKLLEQTDYPLTLAAYADARLVLKIEFDQERYNQEMAGRLLEQMQTVLAGMAENAGQRVGELPLLTTAELRQIMFAWNRTTDCRSDLTIPEAFEQQVARTPDAIALVFEQERLTYCELNERSNQLADYLKQRGAGPETLVALCFERSLDLVVSVLATLKTGGAYLPLDPTYPADRISFMLSDSRAGILLTQECLLEKFPAQHLEVIAVDQQGAFQGLSKENPAISCTPQNLAYVIYTSGSTGQPKGVLVSHENVLRLFETTRAAFNFDSHDVWTLFHSYAFDFSVWELWGALLYGGRLVVVPYWTSRAPENFYQLLCAEQVTVLNQTPSAFRQLIQAESVVGHGNELALRLVIFGGEALELGSLKSWWQRHGDALPQLVNMYGITETTVHVTYRPLGERDVSDAGNIQGSMVGRPLGDLQVFILDGYQNLAPLGVPGELYVGGAGLGRGYLQRPDLTAERFVPNPFSEVPGARLYRSGDLGRYLGDGGIEYLGRSDRQVKVRGFRIELGEIEAVLARQEGVHECVVIAREDQLQGSNLVACLVASGPANNADHLRALLRRQLPDYMIPSALVYLDRLPLTPNGKIDRDGLQSAATADSSGIVLAPRTPTEALLTGIWCSVLEREQVGADDNFFDLGGNSLLATQVISRVRDVFHLELPVRTLFEYPKLEMFGNLIDKRGLAEKRFQSPAMTPLRRDSSKRYAGGSKAEARGLDSTGRK